MQSKVICRTGVDAERTLASMFENVKLIWREWVAQLLTKRQRRQARRNVARVVKL